MKSPSKKQEKERAFIAYQVFIQLLQNQNPRVLKQLDKVLGESEEYVVLALSGLHFDKYDWQTYTRLTAKLIAYKLGYTNGGKKKKAKKR